MKGSVETVEFYGRLILKPEYRKQKVEEREIVEKYIHESIGKVAVGKLNPKYMGPSKDTPCHLFCSGKKTFDKAYDVKLEAKVMLMKLTSFIEEGSSVKFRSWSGQYWRIVLVDGKWVIQDGVLFYDTQSQRDYSNFEIRRGTYATKLTWKELKAAHAYYSKVLEGKKDV